MSSEQQIVAIGGYGDSEQTAALHRFVLGLTNKERPRILHVPTAQCEAAGALVSYYELFAGLGDVSHLRFFPWPPKDLRQLVLSQDAISVGGGNTANMLAIWRVHGFDRILLEAWEAGIVLFGMSAGMICWFEAGVTDSFRPELDGLRDGLGVLPGSSCPHYDAEPMRRPRYRELVNSGFPEGIAADNGVALHYVGTDLRDVVTCRPGTAAYRVSRSGEERIEPRELTA